MHYIQRAGGGAALSAFLLLLGSCIIPGLGAGNVDITVVFSTPAAFSGPDYRVFDSAELGFRETMFECAPPLRHEPYESTDDFWVDRLQATNVTSGHYRIRAFNAPDSRSLEIGVSGFVSATGDYPIDVNAVEFLGLEFEPGSDAAKAVVLAIDRAAAARDGGLGALGFGSAETSYPDRVAARMRAAGHGLRSYPARDPAQAGLAAAAAGLSGVSLLGQADARGRALMARVKADLAEAGIAVLAEDYAASSEELKRKRFEIPGRRIIHYRWVIAHDDVGSLCRALHSGDLAYSAADAGEAPKFHYHANNVPEYYGDLAAENDGLIDRSLFIPLGWKE